MLPICTWRFLASICYAIFFNEKEKKGLTRGIRIYEKGSEEIRRGTDAARQEQVEASKQRVPGNIFLTFCQLNLAR